MNPDLQLSLFFEMLRIRLIEEAILLRYKEQKMRCPIHLSIGQEAIATGICARLTKEDVTFSNHRSHAHYLAKGGNLRKMIAELYGKKTGCTKGRGGSMHLIDLEAGFQGSSPLAGGSIPIAAGFAFGLQMQNSPGICVSFFGEAATEEGLFSEILNFSALKNLPFLLVCENNQYAAHSPTSERQPVKRDLLKLSEAHGVPAFSGNGTLVEEVYATTGKALNSVRQTGSPAFIELTTYRLCEHVGSRHPKQTLTEEDLKLWEQKCPIKTYQDTLLQKEILTLQGLEGMEAKIRLEIEESFSFAEESPLPIFDLDDEKAYAE
jgi:TPP-dependent pyruvate/acetoin dehydrogenase alpha subunit